MNNLTTVNHKVSREERAQHYRHAGAVLWLTGLSASGKSTLSMVLERELMKRGYSCYVLDGDNLRNGLNANLTFSPEDRSENIRRAGEVAALFADAGLICISAFISPYRTDRDIARTACQNFHEIYVATDLATCESRDPKGLYKKARQGLLTEFTGISAPYEPPESFQLTIDTANTPIATSVDRLLDYVLRTIPLAKASDKKFGIE